MIYLIFGPSYTGKTWLAQRLLEHYHFPYLSLDHLKMGLIRSHQTDLTPLDDEQLTHYLWPIVRELMKTVIENDQHLIIEGCSIPYDFQTDLPAAYAAKIQHVCLIFSDDYLHRHEHDIRAHANVIEQRVSDGVSLEELLANHRTALAACQQYGCRYRLIETDYETDLDFKTIFTVH